MLLDQHFHWLIIVVAFECPVENCGKKFSRVDNLVQHTKTHNSGTVRQPKSRSGSVSSGVPARDGSDSPVGYHSGSVSRKPAKRRRTVVKDEDGAIIDDGADSDCESVRGSICSVAYPLLDAP